MPPTASGAQSRKAIGFECVLPGIELILREFVVTAGFFESDLAGLHSGHDCGFPADRPSFGIRRR